MSTNRRNFLRNVTAASALLATDSFAKPFNIIRDLKKISPSLWLPLIYMMDV